MGPPRESIKYAPVEHDSVQTTESADLVSPEVRRLLRDTDTSGQLWLSKMVSLDNQTGAGAKSRGSQVEIKPVRKFSLFEPDMRWQQIIGCLSAHSVSFATGVTMAFTSSLIPALQAEDSDIKATQTQCAWLASSIALTVPIGAVLSGILMEHLGRLSSLQLAILPIFVSWIIIATAPNFTTLIIGRVLVGIMSGIVVSASAVIITETAYKKYRGALLSTGTCLASFGIVSGYVIGALFDWRTSAWVSLITPLIPFVLITLFTAESPIWLRSRGRIQKAEKVSMYYYGDPNYVVQGSALPPTIPPLQNDIDIEKMAAKQKEDTSKQNEEPVKQNEVPVKQNEVPVKQKEELAKEEPAKEEPAKAKRPKASFSRQLWMLLSQPSGYKPLIILNVIFLLQQFTGIYITLYYAVTFFQEAGSTIDPYIATIMVGLMRFLACAGTVFLMRQCKRRPLMLVSSIGMAVCMAVSAYSTSLNLAERDGGDESFLPSWLPVACVVMYILVASIGLQTIPWTMTAELFPQRCRGAAQSANIFISHIFMFATLQAYPTMNHYLGGSVGLQYFFAGSSVVSAIIVWIFFPETHGKTLSEIEDYFRHNTIYLGSNK